MASFMGIDCGCAKRFRWHQFRTLLYCSAVSLSATLFFPGSALAQTAETDVDREERVETSPDYARGDEIVVTARLREERLQDVPIAITAVSGEALEDRAIEDLEDLSQGLPNVFIAENTTVDSIGIRGLSSGVNFGFEQAVGQVIDGFFFGRPRLSRLPFFDIARVEVLKGPQGALIGKNTTAGAINITTNRPSSTFEAHLNAEYEKFEDAGDGYTIDGAVSGPLAQELDGRFAFYHSGGGGYVRNVALDTNVPDKEDFIGRLSLAWQPTTDVDVLFAWTRADLFREGQSKQLAFCSPFFISFLQSRGLFSDCAGPPDKLTSGIGPRNGTGNFDSFSTELDILGLTVNWHFGDYTLTSLTGFGQYESLDFTEGDRTELEIQNTRFRDKYKQWSQEVRFQSPEQQTLTWIAGLYYSKRDNFNRFSFDVDFRPVFAPNPVPAPFPVPVAFPLAASSQNSFTQEDTETFAAFGQLTLRLTEQFAVTVDGRYTHESKQASQRAFYGEIYTDNPVSPIPIPPPFQRPPFNLPPTVGPLLHDIESDRTENNFSPGAVVEWKPSEDTLFYASARRGFKGGGFNFGNLDNQATVPLTFEFDEEKVIAYELGAKLQIGGGLVLNTALYRMEFDDLQVSTIDTRSLVGLALQRTTNAASAISQGLEVEASWEPIERLRLDVALGYNDAKYAEYQGVPCFVGQTVAQGCLAGPTPSPRDDVQDLAGKPIANAPEWSGSAGARYVWILPRDYRLTTFAQAVYRDEYFTLTALDPRSVQEAYVKINARIALADPSRNWEIALIGRNLTDKITSSFIQPLAPIVENPSRTYNAFVDPGRSFILQLQLSF